MNQTTIEWCQASWNPATGCGDDVVSAGCRNCYARRLSRRLAGRAGYPAADAPGGGSFAVTRRPDRLGEPVGWTKPTRVFVCSMGDLFHAEIPFEYIAAVYGAMCVTPRHTFCVLTKRPWRRKVFKEWVQENKRGYCHGEGGLTGNCYGEQVGINGPEMAEWNRRHKAAVRHYWPQIPDPAETIGDACLSPPWPLPNVWEGVTVENQAAADERIPLVLETPAAMRFVSVEPMLGAVDLTAWLPRTLTVEQRNDLYDATRSSPPDGYGLAVQQAENLPALDWVIAGGETGPGARPVHPDWLRALRDQCIEAGVPFFFKHWGEWAPHNVTDSAPWAWGHGRYADWRGDDYPEHARGWHFAKFRGGMTCCARLGRKQTGRFVDGRTWDGAPLVPDAGGLVTESAEGAKVQNDG